MSLETGFTDFRSSFIAVGFDAVDFLRGVPLISAVAAVVFCARAFDLTEASRLLEIVFFSWTSRKIEIKIKKA